MGTALILIGVACVIAAIVGGGVKLHNIEVGSVPSLWRQLLLAAFGLGISLAGAASNGSLDMDDSGDAGIENAFVDVSADNQVMANAAVETPPADNAAVEAPPADKGVEQAQAPPPPPDDALAEFEIEDEVPPPPAEAPPEARRMLVSNRCPEEIDLSVVHRTAVGWMDNGGSIWHLAGNVSSELSYNGAELASVSPEVYFYAKTASGKLWDGEYKTGPFERLRKHMMSITNDGRYLLDLTC